MEQLWTAADLAKYLGYSETTVTRMASSHPDRLPPRVPTSLLRWVPDVCRKWAMGSAASPPPPAPKRKPGRPRKVAAA